MDTQECEIELLDNLWLGFYDVISVALEDGSELPIWAAQSERLQAEANGDIAKLLLVSLHRSLGGAPRRLSRSSRREARLAGTSTSLNR
ncbi:hypothetical protein [Pseudomonas xanthosomatis]|uniref:hypothetical protein n=1 Tax=Pseudomonas xanthosomatis TaxID=2842356 RepID=UPI00351412DC